MAIAPTGAIYKALSFDNTSSRNYGVYITGEAVYNAPERDVEMIDIPGRNGAYALDNGRFQNIEVTYLAGITADTEANFRQAISDFRNFLCSKKGYVRLTDDYNPDEYRMAIYKSGLEVTPAQLKAGEFDITFECKPQRFLMSGESTIGVTSGDTLLNPTLFESSPLLMIYGYGNIGINNSAITINNIEVGKIPLFNIPYSKRTVTGRNNQYYFGGSFDADLLATGDVITVSRVDAIVEYYETSNWEIVNSSIYSESGSTMSYYTYDGLSYTYTGYGLVGYRFLNMTFNKGTSKTYSRTTNFKIEYYDQNGNTQYEYMEITVELTYEGDGSFVLAVQVPAQLPAEHSASRYIKINEYNNDKTVYAVSTKSALGSPLYIDCEIGEAYKFEGDSVVSINDVASLPAELPTLEAGANTITYSNTITQLDIVPRWWKV